MLSAHLLLYERPRYLLLPQLLQACLLHASQFHFHIIPTETCPQFAWEAGILLSLDRKIIFQIILRYNLFNELLRFTNTNDLIKV